ncbi:Guanosine-3',5'-bis(diphosphate) 3'-pyrophosphohydrolase [Botrimarina colliarenosi]|uniref:Guanosine-3',5'-bis(Diphosphate) 3'-pyrophosphohydrolase n=1 Tax=Botrimarina colliarenosi TaxID=2528001 RepID=A0A5C6A2K9_9BACT|nr:HD domain-containing protein [Botrimarina colliarenosi]TWT94134.1 Guanosine-3',5'-bis(diphosphate) 3'-pyrophosphohydrolase [Botrimarina colliarenosi]
MPSSDPQQQSATDLVELACAIATQAHEGQFRRDGVTLYIEHPAAVASRSPKAPHSQAVAWLHDVLEDTEMTREDLLDRGIPDGVVSAVEALTKQEGLSYEENLERAAADVLAREVKIADMLSNLADHPTPNQIRKYARGLLLLLGE